MDKIEDHQLFLCIVDSGSLHRAGDQLKVSTSAVSRQLKRIEQTLGVTLIKRTTRRLSVTQEGQIYYDACRRMDEEMRTMQQRLQSLQGKPLGRLRITVTRAFAYAQLMDAICHFSRIYPDITFDLDVNDSQVDLVEAGVDVAIRIGQLKDSRLRSRCLLRTLLIPCAAPAYLENKGVPLSLPDLAGHDLITTSHLPRIEKRQLQQLAIAEVPNSQKKLIVNDVVSVYQAVAAGLGISFLPSYLIQNDVDQGRLVALLTDSQPITHEVYAVYVNSDFLPQKTRLFIDFLADWFGSEINQRTTSHDEP